MTSDETTGGPFPPLSATTAAMARPSPRFWSYARPDAAAGPAALAACRPELMEREEIRSELLAAMNHELRTPLNAVIGFAAMIQQEMLGPVGNRTYKAYAGDIVTSAEQLLATVESILALVARQGPSEPPGQPG